MSTCETNQENLKAYMDGELPIVSRLNVRWHLAHCAACREEIEAMEQIGNELRAADEGGLEPALRAKILSGFPDAPPEMPEAAAKKSKWRSKPMLAFGAVASATALWFLFYPTLSSVTGSRKQVYGQASGRAASNAATASAPLAASPLTKEKMETDPVQSGGHTTFDEEAKEVARHERHIDAPVVSGTLQDGDASVAHEHKQEMAKAARPYGSGGFASGWNTRSAAGASAPSAPRAEVATGKSVDGLETLQRENPQHLKWAYPAKRVAGGKNDVTGWGVDVTALAERQVHREASITLEVDSPEAKSESIEEMVKAEGGYVASNQVNTEEDGTKTASLELKIPVKDFDSFLKSVAKLGNVKAKNISGEDVTEKMSDEQQTQRVLQQDARDTEAKLKLRSSRAQHREDAESLRQLRIRAAQSKARLEMLKKFATLSNVSVELREKPKKTSEAPQTQPSGFVGDLKSTAQDAMHSFAEAARMPILLLVWALVYSPVVIALFLAYRYVRKHA